VNYIVYIHFLVNFSCVKHEFVSIYLKFWDALHLSYKFFCKCQWYRI